MYFLFYLKLLQIEDSGVEILNLLNYRLIMFGWNIRDYDIKLELAACSNGTVYMAKYLPNAHYVALKKYHLDKNGTKQVAEHIQDEVLAMRLFSHPNLHTFFTAFVNDSDLCVVSPLMCFGSCRDTIRNCFNTGGMGFSWAFKM